MTLNFKILGTPQAKQSFRYAVRPGKNGKNFVSKYQPKEVMENETNLKWAITSQLPPDFKPLDCALDVSLLFVFPALKSWSKREKLALIVGTVYHSSKPDVDNCQKSVFDAMQGIVFINDSRISKLSVTKVYGDIPRTEIEVKPIN